MGRSYGEAGRYVAGAKSIAAMGRSYWLPRAQVLPSAVEIPFR